ncbi:MAG: patatin-like phospholipase family protein [Mycobacteriales bacterium]
MIAFVLGGGGLLGASEVGMLQALAAAGIAPDLVLGSSVGALNGAVVAAAPGLETADHLAELWSELGRRDVFGSGVVGQVRNLVRTGTSLHDNAGLRSLIAAYAGSTRIEDLPVPFQCVAASIERARAHWFFDGPVVEAVLASCAVPGLLPPVRIGVEHFVDGGLVHSIPVGRAVELGATEIFVLQVGRIEQPLTVPRRPWQVGLVAFELARRHRFTEEMASLPEQLAVHVLPTGEDSTPLANLRYREARGVRPRIARARAASSAYLQAVGR